MKIRSPKHPSESFDIDFHRSKQFDMVGFGLNSIDHVCIVPSYPSFDTKTEIIHYEKFPGGQVATTVVFLSRLGRKVKYIGKVGGDDLGQLSIQSLRSEDVDTSSVLIEEGARNQYAFIIIDQISGERTILWERDKRLNFHHSELERELVCSGRLLYLDGYDYESALQAAAWAQEENIPVVIDLDKLSSDGMELISKIDFLICSENIPREIAGTENLEDALWKLKDFCNGFLAVTLGDRGAMAIVGNECLRFPAYDVHAVDTTGAGDIFHGGFAYGLLQNWPLQKIMSFANASAGLNCTKLGARAALPNLPEILKLMDEGTSKGSNTEK